MMSRYRLVRLVLAVLAAPAAPVGSDALGASPGEVMLRIEVVGAGTGGVASLPAGVHCRGGICIGTFARGTTITLSADPANGSRFVGWTGACAGLVRCVLKAGEPVTLGVRLEPLR